MMKRALTIIMAKIALAARLLIRVVRKSFVTMIVLAKYVVALIIKVINAVLIFLAMLAKYAAGLILSGIKGTKKLAVISTTVIAHWSIWLIKGVTTLIARWSVWLARGIKTLSTTIVTSVRRFLSIRWINRALVMIIITAACVVGFLSVRGALPFLPVFGNSMEPELQAGNLILLEETSPYDVEVGDIIAFSIPEMVRDYYNYPPVIAHRVVAVYDPEGAIKFRTKGDNTGEDPFTVRPEDLMGKVTKQIPYIGFPLLFFQSQQGLIFVITFLSLLALYLYADEINNGRRWVQRGVFSPVIRESRRSSRVLEKRIETSEKTMAGTQEALTSFASAIAEYAEHLKSHTNAIQGLSDASQELKKGAVEQNRVLAHFMEVIDQKDSEVKAKTVEVEEVKAEQEEAKPEIATHYPPGCFKNRRQNAEDE
ncbi:signal peptidase I [Chloroflexota bacterium]